MASRVFGTLADGGVVQEVTIAAGDLTATIITLGAVIRDVRLAGIEHPLVLGFDRLEDYVQHSPHFGALAGRSANRIGRGRFAIDGKTYRVSLNENGRQHLHGGVNGFGRRNWRLVASDAASVTLALSSPAGEEGYPGNVEATVNYRIEAPSTIRMEATATTDAPTLVNLAQHTYFNLDGTPDILDHVVQIFAGYYTPTDADLIPTGEIVSVAGSDYDFRAPKPIRQTRAGARIAFDKNWVVARQKSAEMRPLARLASPKSGLSLSVASTEPGVQFYDGSYLAVPVPGLDGRRYAANAGCCFEPQLFPDAPNHPGFPTSILRPGETYRQVSTFAFARV